MDGCSIRCQLLRGTRLTAVSPRKNLQFELYSIANARLLNRASPDSGMPGTVKPHFYLSSLQL